MRACDRLTDYRNKKKSKWLFFLDTGIFTRIPLLFLVYFYYFFRLKRLRVKAIFQARPFRSLQTAPVISPSPFPLLLAAVDRCAPHRLPPVAIPIPLLRAIAPVGPTTTPISHLPLESRSNLVRPRPDFQHSAALYFLSPLPPPSPHTATTTASRSPRRTAILSSSKSLDLHPICAAIRSINNHDLAQLKPPNNNNIFIYYLYIKNTRKNNKKTSVNQLSNHGHVRLKSSSQCSCPTRCRPSLQRLRHRVVLRDPPSTNTYNV